jgi:hypothetical protein
MHSCTITTNHNKTNAKILPQANKIGIEVSCQYFIMSVHNCCINYLRNESTGLQFNENNDLINVRGINAFYAVFLTREGRQGYCGIISYSAQ